MYVSPFERKSRAAAGGSFVGGLCAVCFGRLLLAHSGAFQMFRALGALFLTVGWPLLALAPICLAPSIVSFVLHRRRRRRFPDFVLFSIAVNREIVEDASILSTQLFDALHPHAVEHAVAAYHVAEGGGSDDGRRYVFLLGVHRSIAEKADRAISSVFNGRGALVREVDPEGSPLHGHVYEAWRREEERQAHERAEREATRERARAASSHSDAEDKLALFDDLDDDERAPTLLGAEG